jgi:hypothetical protein
MQIRMNYTKTLLALGITQIEDKQNTKQKANTMCNMGPTKTSGINTSVREG